MQAEDAGPVLHDDAVGMLGAGEEGGMGGERVSGFLVAERGLNGRQTPRRASERQQPAAVTLAEDGDSDEGRVDIRTTNRLCSMTALPWLPELHCVGGGHRLLHRC